MNELTNTKAFSFNADNTFHSFSDYAGKYLQSPLFQTEHNVRLLLPKFGKSLLSNDGNIIFVHTYAQASSTDRLFSDDRMVLRQRMILCFLRFAKIYGIKIYEGTHSRKGLLVFKYNEEENSIPARLTYVVNFQEKIFRCILSEDEFIITEDEKAEIAQFAELLMP